MSLVVVSVGEAIATPLPASGEYVNIGACMLVSLAVTFSIAAIELVNTAESLVLEGTNTLLIPGWASELGAIEERIGKLELSLVVGPGVGVIYEVDRIVSGSPVASGLPSGSKKVMAGMIDVKIVCWIGSTTSAVSALTGC